MGAESARIEHLQLIQQIISRLARNSFTIKAGSTTVAAALVAVTFGSSKPEVALIGLVLLVMFWGLDAFYLGQERLFRGLYNNVRRGPPPTFGSEGYFSMDITTPRGLRRVVPTLLLPMFSRTLPIFYGALLILLIVTAFVATDAAAEKIVQAIHT